MLIIELNSFMKSSDVQSRPGMATIISKAGGSGVGINKACGQEEKKDERLPCTQAAANTMRMR